MPTLNDAVARARSIAIAAIEELDTFVQSFDQHTVDQARAAILGTADEPDGAYDSNWEEQHIAMMLLFAVSTRRGQAVLRDEP